MKNQSSAIILAAGMSERMGKPKFALKFNKNKTFIEEIVHRFAEFDCEEIIVVMNKAGKGLLDKLKIQLPETVKVAINPHPESGRFSSIKKGLGQLKNQNSVFIHNVDNPFVEASLLKSLFICLQQADYCVPMFKDRGGHPILISGKLIDTINNCVKDDLNLKEYLKAFMKKNIETDNPGILININSIEEYRELFPGI